MEIAGDNTEQMSGFSLALSQQSFAYDYYVTLDCLKFSRPETKNAQQGAVVLNQYERVQLINGQWKTDKEPTPTVFSKTWSMAPDSFKATTLVSVETPPNETFNMPIAISGQTAIVGVPWIDDAQGAVYVYDTTTSKRIAELTLEDGDSKQPFGVSVALSENTALVGTKGVKDSPAAVYVFDLVEGEQTARFTVKDDTKKLAKPIYPTVGISGSTAIVGLPGYIGTDGPTLQIGRTVYLLDTQTGEQRAKLTPSDGNIEKDWFGTAVAISGDVAIVGAPAENKGVGAAYLFDAKTGKLLAKLVADEEKKQQAFFGRSVAISGNTAIIGAYGQDDYNGAAYLFDVSTGKQVAKLTAGNAAGLGFFGMSVAISGNKAVVGATGMPMGDEGDKYMPGSVYVFDATTGAQTSWISAGNPQNRRFFGAAVGVSGDTILVQAGEVSQDKAASSTTYMFQRD